MINGFSIDLEDWFCVKNFSNSFPIEEWEKQEFRIVKNTERLLEILKKHNTKATFFILGWIAEKTPDLIKNIHKEGHEIASHGFSHSLVKDITPEKFRDELIKTNKAIKAAVNVDVKGFRAPSFSVKESKKWIFEILKEERFTYDSSIFPVSFHPDYANGDAPLTIYKTKSGIIEFPMSCFKFAGVKLPCSGGGYFRLLPYNYTKFGIKSCNNAGRPAVFYLHPWEIDPKQPRVKDLPFTKKLRHYINLSKTEKRLEKLLSDFKFDTISNVISKYYNEV